MNDDIDVCLKMWYNLAKNQGQRKWNGQRLLFVLVRGWPIKSLCQISGNGKHCGKCMEWQGRTRKMKKLIHCGIVRSRKTQSWWQGSAEKEEPKPIAADRPQWWSYTRVKFTVSCWHLQQHGAWGWINCVPQTLDGGQHWWQKWWMVPVGGGEWQGKVYARVNPGLMVGQGNVSLLPGKSVWYRLASRV